MDSSSIFSSKRRFAFKLSLFIVLLAILDAGIGGLLREFYFRQTSGLSYRLTYAMDHSTDDVIVLGSSRAQVHYVPSIIEKITGKSCYNAGRDGQSLLFSYAVQEAIIKRHQPDVLILDLIPRDFFNLSIHYDRLSALLPYYDSHEEIRPIVHLRSRFERLKLISHIYPFNSLPLQIAKYNLVKGEELDGYVPQFGEMTPLMQTQEEENAPWSRKGLDPNMVRAFESLVENCVDSKIVLFIVISPAYQGKAPGMFAIDKLKEIMENCSFEIWDYSNHSDFANETRLFRDQSHLNYDGARLFTDLVAKRINATLGQDSKEFSFRQAATAKKN